MTAPAREVAPGTWELVTSWTRPPLSLNDRGHWRGRARKIADVRREVAWLAKTIPGPFDRVRVTLHYRPRDRRRRDQDNLWATGKVCCDAIVDAKIVTDDAPEYMAKEMPVLHPAEKGRPGAVWLVVEQLRDPVAARSLTPHDAQHTTRHVA